MPLGGEMRRAKDWEREYNWSGVRGKDGVNGPNVWYTVN